VANQKKKKVRKEKNYPKNQISSRPYWNEKKEHYLMKNTK
jgi:NADPH-dependent ferric siderophore reductase